MPLTVLKYAIIALVVWLTVVWVAGTIYVAVSYVVAQRHMPKRAPGHLSVLFDREIADAVCEFLTAETAGLERLPAD